MHPSCTPAGHRNRRRPDPHRPESDSLQHFSDGASRDRTGDLLRARQALSHLSYGPDANEFTREAGGWLAQPSKSKSRGGRCSNQRRSWSGVSWRNSGVSSETSSCGGSSLVSKARSTSNSAVSSGRRHLVRPARGDHRQGWLLEPVRARQLRAAPGRRRHTARRARHQIAGRQPQRGRRSRPAGP